MATASGILMKNSHTGGKPVDFAALDAVHRQIHENLAALTDLARQIATNGVDIGVEQRARAIEAFFSGTSRQHHAEEERSVFPPLLQSASPELVEAVRTLQQDHGWIEENWIELGPQLRAIASGHHGVDSTELQQAVEVFVALCEDHVALEESLVYPESKARWAQVLARRATRPSA